MYIIELYTAAVYKICIMASIWGSDIFGGRVSVSSNPSAGNPSESKRDLRGKVRGLCKRDGCQGVSNEDTNIVDI